MKPNTVEAPAIGRTQYPGTAIRDSADVIASVEVPKKQASWANSFNRIMERGYLSGNILKNPHLISMNELSDYTVPAITIHLEKFIVESDGQKTFDYAEMSVVVAVAVRISDNLVTQFARVKRGMERERRIGLGAIGMPVVLNALGYSQHTQAAWVKSSQILETLRLTAYRTSVGLAAERGQYPAFDIEETLDDTAVRVLPGELREDIAYFGLRNAQLFRQPLSADE